MVALSYTINNAFVSHFLKYLKVGLGTTMILTIASNGSTKLQAMYIFPYIMWVRMCSTSGFPELNSDRNLAYWLHPALCPLVAVMFM